MLIGSRDIIGGVNWAQGLKSRGDEVPALVEKGKSEFGGCELRGKTLGVVGLGAIGAMVANDALSLGMQVIGYDPYLSVEAAWDISSDVKKASGLEVLLREVDYLTIHVPLLDSTKGMYNAEKFSMMRDGVKIINLARGGLVNNKDIKEAIKSGKVGAYITDFPAVELLGVDGVIPVPHLGASTKESEENCAIMAAIQLKNFLETGSIKNSVNFPNCELSMKGDKKRIIIANSNVPNMLSIITTLLAKNSINIYDMLNKSKNGIAYNIIDIDGDISNGILDKILSVEGILMAKILE
jgi:D-3-phosphoglycerate dehydrogenase